MNIKRIFPIEINLVIKNFREICFQQRLVDNLGDSTRCFFLDAASYNNLGDQAIALAMEKFLGDIFGSENVLVISECDILKYIKVLKKIIRPSDVIVLTGGGNMGDLYPRYEAIRRKIIRKFNDNKIVIFPQTIDYSNDSYGMYELKRSCKLYNSHSNIHICAREEKSYVLMKSYYNNVILVPDIVFYLKDKIEIKEKKRKYAYGICLRNDRESTLSINDKELILNIGAKNNENVVELNTMDLTGSVLLNYVQREKAICRKLEEFRECELIITDRLHGMIFSMISGVPCLAIDNSNHKVSGVYKCIEKYSKGVLVISSKDLSSIEDSIRRIRIMDTNIEIDDIYNMLKQILNGE